MPRRVHIKRVQIKREKIRLTSRGERFSGVFKCSCCKQCHSDGWIYKGEDSSILHICYECKYRLTTVTKAKSIPQAKIVYSSFESNKSKH